MFCSLHRGLTRIEDRMGLSSLRLTVKWNKLLLSNVAYPFGNKRATTVQEPSVLAVEAASSLDLTS